MASIPRDRGQVTQPLQVWTQRGSESESFLSRKGPLPLGLSCVSWCETAVCGGVGWGAHTCVWRQGYMRTKRQVQPLPKAASGMHTHAQAYMLQARPRAEAVGRRESFSHSPAQGPLCLQPMGPSWSARQLEGPWSPRPPATHRVSRVQSHTQPHPSRRSQHPH